MTGSFEAVKGQSFATFDQWVNKASSWLTSHPEYRDTQHPKKKGWQGYHFTAMAFDQLGRRCRNGADMMRARDEMVFPVWWVWPDQIAALIMPPTPVDASAGAETDSKGCE